MLSSTTTDEGVAAAPEPLLSRLSRIGWPRLLRLWSGTIIFVFLTMHLINHSAGLFGSFALDVLQTWRWKLWMNPLGLTLLYGAFATHIFFGIWRIASRKTLRMPLDEAVQLVTALLIPVLLMPHFVHTRISGTWFGGDGFYGTVLRELWPNRFLWQTALILVAWGHGVLGIQMAFRHRPWFPRIQPAGLVLAIVIPTLAIAGFIAGGREARLQPPAPEYMSEEQKAGLQRAGMLGFAGLGALALAMAGILQIGYVRRRLGNKIVLNYRGRGPVRVPIGTTVLEASRIHEIPHPSVCRGRGRCSTCRVQILSDPDKLPPPSDLEQAVLDRVGALKNVRLACQLRPENDVSLRILLPVLGKSQDPESQVEVERWAVERVATVLVLDMRAFNVLVHSQVPYELVALVNRFSSEMRQAVNNHGGSVSAFYGDGLVAVFDNPQGERAGARQALAAARDMSHVIQVLNKEMGGALPIPVRIGIGIHAGRVTLARVGTSEARSELMAFGSAVNIAGALEAATSHALVDCLVSDAAARLARFDTAGLKVHEVEVDGIEGAVKSFAVSDWRMMRKRITEEEAPVAATSQEG